VVTETWWTTEPPRLRISTTAAPAATSRPPVLMLHGLWHAAWAWENWTAQFAEHGHTCHAVDLRGHGDSDGDATTARVRDFVEDARRTVAALPEPPILIGHSLGGSLVEHLLAADDYPAAVLVSGVPGRYPIGTVLRTSISRPASTMATIRQRDLHPLVATADGARRFLFSPGTQEETVRRIQPRLTAAAPHVIRELIRHPPTKPRTGTPILVLAATRDAAFRPRTQRRHARDIGADYLEILGSGHDIPLDHAWDVAAEVVIDWLRRLHPA
jgi:pimeloyl-ACP methyl ester carboxylesterase